MLAGIGVALATGIVVAGAASVVPVRRAKATVADGSPRFARSDVSALVNRHESQITFSISAAVAAGLASQSNAARPAMCGVAIDDPLID